MPPSGRDPLNKTEDTSDCSQLNCGPEAGCVRQESGLFACRCPHDFSEPVNGRCPRIIVSGQPATIPSLIPRSRNATRNPDLFDKPQNFMLTPSDSTSLIAAWSLGSSLLIAVILMVVLMWWKRRLQPSVRHHKQQIHLPATPNEDEKLQSQMLVSLSKATLLESRFMTNPSYWALDGSDLEKVPPEVAIVPRDRILLLHEIGEGCFGKVYKGQLREPAPTVNGGESAQIVAVKVLKDSATPEAREDFFREAGIMTSFKHRNILSLRGLVVNESHGCPWMLFEYMSLGDLAQLLRSNASKQFSGNGASLKLTKEDLYDIALQISAGMAYLSSHHFVHRDLACRNCLVAQDLTVKISDFGMSRDVYTCDYYKIGGSRMLPVRWMSPESIMYGKFTLESDVWSFGVVLWEIYSFGKQPYYGHSNEEVVKLILQGILMTPPQDAPLLICELMQGCWKTQPSDRLTFNQIHGKLLDNQRGVLTKSARPNNKGQLHVTYSNVEQLDWQNYLVPKTQSRTEYLQPLPDLQPNEHTYVNEQ